MISKNHCMMNMEDEEEYLDFYDFSKTYENMPGIVLEKKTVEKPIKEEDEDDEGSWEDLGDNDKEAKKSQGSWEDCDEESLDDMQIEESKLDGKTGGLEGSQVDKPLDGFEILDSEKTSQIDVAFKPKTAADSKNKTREEVFAELNIKRARLLPNGEVELGNGKIMGNRKWQYIYKQKPRVPDDRESVVIGKLQIEHKKMMAL